MKKSYILARVRLIGWLFFDGQQFVSDSNKSYIFPTLVQAEQYAANLSKEVTVDVIEHYSGLGDNVKTFQHVA